MYRKKKPETARGRCDSFVVETDVHHPTDTNLLWDSMRCLIRETGPCSEETRGGRLASVEVSDGSCKERLQPDTPDASGECGPIPGRLSVYLRGVVEAGRADAVAIVGQAGSGAGKPLRVYTTLHQTCASSDGSGGEEIDQGRGDSPRGEGIFDIRAAH